MTSGNTTDERYRALLDVSEKIAAHRDLAAPSHDVRVRGCVLAVGRYFFGRGAAGFLDEEGRAAGGGGGGGVGGSGSTAARNGSTPVFSMIDFLSARVRTRRAIFCFRIRPNRDLSPLRRDMVNTCFQNKCKGDRCSRQPASLKESTLHAAIRAQRRTIRRRRERAGHERHHRRNLVNRGKTLQ
jgi:hypothetical protein